MVPHSDWIEVEGSPYHKARTVNPALPGFRYDPVLRPRASMTMAVGEPLDASEGHRWRLVMTFTRYTWRERWFDFTFQHNLPLKLGPLVLADPQIILSPSNHLAVSTEWLKE